LVYQYTERQDSIEHVMKVARPTTKLWKELSKVILALSLVILTTNPTYAYSQRVKDACTDDYWRLCSYLDHRSRGVQDCFYFNRGSISWQCKAAILSEGLYRKYRQAKGDE
jgi:hypothetical protein